MWFDAAVEDSPEEQPDNDVTLTPQSQSGSALPDNVVESVVIATCVILVAIAVFTAIVIKKQRRKRAAAAAEGEMQMASLEQQSSTAASVGGGGESAYSVVSAPSSYGTNVDVASAYQLNPTYSYGGF